MSFLNKIDNNINWVKSCATSCVSKIGRYTSTWTDRLYKISNSILGQKAMLMAYENVAESAAYYVGGELAAPLGKRIGSAIGKSLGNVAFFGASLFVTANRNSLTQIGVDTGGLAGEQIIYFTAGIICAFLAIKLAGSNEIFWTTSNIVETYPFKTVVSMAGTCALNTAFPALQNRYTQLLTDLAIGSLIYNSWDTAEFLSKIMAGKCLDRILPKKISLPESSNHLLEECSNQFVDAALTTTADYISTYSSIPIQFPQDLITCLKSILKDQSIILFAASPSQAENLKQLSEDMVSNMIIRGINLYVEMHNNHPENVSNLKLGYSLIQKEIEELERSLPLEQREQIQTVIKNLSIQLWSPLFKTTFDSNLQNSMILKFLLSTQFITPENLSFITLKLEKWITDKEKELCGFVLSKEHETLKIQSFLEKHLENLVKCMILSHPFMVIPIQDCEARRFYQNICEIIPRYYETLINPLITTHLIKLLKHQVANSEFSF